MESLIEWYANNGEALWATIISFFSAYGVALVSLVVGIIKAKLSAIAQEKASNEKIQELTNKINARLDELENSVIEASNVNTQKRIEAMQDIADSVNKANAALQEAQITDASSVLETIEE